MNWEKFRSLARATFKKFKISCELGKTWKKNPNFESMDELGKVMS